MLLYIFLFLSIFHPLTGSKVCGTHPYRPYNLTGCKCCTDVQFKYSPQQYPWQEHALNQFRAYVTDRVTDGIDGYCDSSSFGNPACSTVLVKGDIILSGSKPSRENPIQARVEEMCYSSCDHGLIALKNGDWLGWLCGALDGEFDYSRQSKGWVETMERIQRNPISCYHWDRISNVHLGTPDLTIMGPTRVGYQMTLVNGSLTVYCCRNGDMCNEGRNDNQWIKCKINKKFYWDHN